LINKTIEQYDNILKACKDVFVKKTKDYGTSWTILRPSSLTDQMFIKAQRIRTIEEKGEQKIDEEIDDEFIALINYGAMALIQTELGADINGKELGEKAIQFYDKKIEETKDLMIKKNHDYGEAWRSMRTSSFTDLILTKIKRIKQIEENKGATIISEGVEGNYYDIINYAIFALIKLSEAA